MKRVVSKLLPRINVLCVDEPRPLLRALSESLFDETRPTLPGKVRKLIMLIIMNTQTSLNFPDRVVSRRPSNLVCIGTNGEKIESNCKIEKFPQNSYLQVTRYVQ